MQSLILDQGNLEPRRQQQEKIKRRLALERCPTCGQIVAPILRLPKVKQRIYECIVAHPHGIGIRQVMDAVYGDDPNGGPESLNVISVHIRKLNHQLKIIGLIIRGTGGPGSVYTVRAIDG